MKKDWIVLGGCVCLFSAGYVFSRLIAQLLHPTELGLTWENKIDIGTIFNIVAAVATSLAAFAAFQSAKIARDAAKDSQAFARTQTYTSHQQQFDRLLDECQSEMGIAFFRRIELYDKLFPANRDSSKPFNTFGNSALIRAWSDSYAKLRSVVANDVPPEFEGIHEWMIGCLVLANEINFTHKEPTQGQVWFNDKTYTFFDHRPGKPLHNLAEVIYRVARFSLIEQPPGHIKNSEQPNFIAAYQEFYQYIKDGMTPHRIR